MLLFLLLSGVCYFSVQVSGGVLFKAPPGPNEDGIIWETYLWMEEPPVKQRLCVRNVCRPLECRLYKLSADNGWPRSAYREVSERKLRRLLRWCDWEQDEADEAQYRKGGLWDTAKQKVKSMFIFPGTKWCGMGNRAKHYSDLGRHGEVDQCCREHDMCPFFIESGACVEDAYAGEGRTFCNNSSITMVHCDCDEQFKKCLQGVTTATANIIEHIFFDVVGGKCFLNAPPNGAFVAKKVDFPPVDLGLVFQSAIASLVPSIF